MFIINFFTLDFKAYYNITQTLRLVQFGITFENFTFIQKINSLLIMVNFHYFGIFVLYFKLEKQK